MIRAFQCFAMNVMMKNHEPFLLENDALSVCCLGKQKHFVCIRSYKDDFECCL